MAAVPATINGTPVTMGLDTGASTLVTPSTTTELRLSRDHRRTRSFGSTAVRIVNNVILRDLEFGGMHEDYKSVPSIAVTHRVTSGPKNTVGKNIAGLIGADTLARYDVDLDFGRKTITLYQVRGCPNLKPEWTGPYTSMPLRIMNRRLSLTVELDGRKLIAIFDTGASQSAVLRSSALRAGVTSEMLKKDIRQSVIGAGDVVANLSVHRFQTFKIGEETLRDIPIGILEVSLLGADMLLGRDYMGTGRFWISHATRTLFVQPGSRIPAVTQKEFDAAVRDWSATRPYYQATPPVKQTQNCAPGEVWALNRCIKEPLPATASDAGSATKADEKLAPSLPSSAIASCNYRTVGVDPKCPRPAAKAAPPPSPQYAQTRELDPASLKELNLDQAYAQLVVLPYASGDGGLETGDVIIALNGETLERDTFTKDALRQRETGSKVDMTVLRKGAKVVVSVPVLRVSQISSTRLSAVFVFSPEKVIEAEATLATLYPKDRFREIWWRTQLNLGMITLDLPSAKRADNMETAIKALERVLDIITEASRPLDWAAAQTHMARAYRLRIQGETADNIELSIVATRLALKVYGQPSGIPVPAYKLVWAKTMTTLGSAYMERKLGSRRGNIEEAIRAYANAMTVLTSMVSPSEWAAVQNDLGVAYTLREQGDPDQNIEQAIKAYEAALTFRTAKFTPLEWARTQKLLGLAYQARKTGERRNNLEKATNAYNAALTVLASKDLDYWLIKDYLTTMQTKS